jgi:hypothetical protein
VSPRLSIVAVLFVACGSATAPATTPAEVSSTNGNEAAPEPESSTTIVPPLSAIPNCDMYLRLYERCEPALTQSIASGDRRAFVAERAWIEYIASTPEVAGLPDACAEMTRELQAVCP